MEKKRIKNYNEKIYFICYIKPSYPSEINIILHPKSAGSYSKLSGRTKGKNKLLYLEKEEKWLKQIEYRKYYRPQWWPQKENYDGRSKTRRYFKALPKPLIDRIKEKISLTNFYSLTDFDEYVIDCMLDSQYFRKSFCESIDEFDFVIKNDSFSPLDFILSRFVEWMIIWSRDTLRSALGEKITNKEIYDSVTMAYKNVVKNQDISRYKKKYEDLDSLLYKEISNIKKSSDLQKKLDGYEYWMFIPMSVINKIKEISLLGQTEKYFSSIDTENKTSNQTISKLLPNLNSQKE